MIVLEPQISLLGRGLALTVHLLALLAVFLAAIAWLWQWSLALLIVLSAYRNLCHGGDIPIRRLVISASRCSCDDGTRQWQALPPRTHYLGEWLIVLSVGGRKPGRRLWLMFWRGTLPVHQDWQLRRWLLAQQR